MIDTQKLEKIRIILRAQCWEKIVNQCTDNIISQIQIDKDNSNLELFQSLKQNIRIKPFEYKPTKKDMDTFLSYIYVWKGLNTKLIDQANQPSSFKHYQQKAKNWANGARARQYSLQLYPNMIKAMQNYVAETILRGCDTGLSSILKLLNDSIEYSCLIQLCLSSVKIINGKRKVLLLAVIH